MLTTRLLRNNGDKMEFVYKFLFTFPLQVQTITDHFKPDQSESVFTIVLCWQACFYKHRVIFSLITKGSRVLTLFNLNPVPFAHFSDQTQMESRNAQSSIHSFFHFDAQLNSACL